jgi:sugar phosphate isomerase/epimerase
MVLLGFSTSDIIHSKLSLEEKVNLYHSFGASAIELGFSGLNEIQDFNLSQELKRLLSSFSFVSIHAPSGGFLYGSNSETKATISFLKKICRQCPIKAIALHPDTIDDFPLLNQSGLPFVLENMDKNKRFGTSLADFEKLKRKCSFGYVLDIEHAYENDPSMHLAGEFIKLMGNRIRYFHVSGMTEKCNHSLVYLSENKKEIMGLLNQNPNVPRILEGILAGNIEEKIACELDFIRDRPDSLLEPSIRI